LCTITRGEDRNAGAKHPRSKHHYVPPIADSSTAAYNNKDHSIPGLTPFPSAPTHHAHFCALPLPAVSPRRGRALWRGEGLRGLYGCPWAVRTNHEGFWMRTQGPGWRRRTHGGMRRGGNANMDAGIGRERAVPNNDVLRRAPCGDMTNPLPCEMQL
jgi:hypothetical protein